MVVGVTAFCTWGGGNTESTTKQDLTTGPYFWQHDTVANAISSTSKATCSNYRVVITAQLYHIQKA